TYLEDLPGPDQVNVAGDVMGPRQKSHILSVDMTYDLNTQWTLGAKYGFRSGEVETRGSGAFTKDRASLAILRLDYNFVHNWSAMAEVRQLGLHESDVTENGAVAALYRHFGQNLRLGAGYNWGDVSDDLRLIE